MSNRKKVVNPETGEVTKVYMTRAERRAKRNVKRVAAGSPPEVHVNANRKDAKEASSKAPPSSYNRVIELVDPKTGLPVTEPRIVEGVSSTGFLIDGVKYVWDQLDGAEGFTRWARTHETKFRELAMKLIPSQVTMMEKGIGVDIVIQHALPPPGYQPFGEPNINIIPGEAVHTEPPHKVDIEALREALAALPSEERAKLMESTQPPSKDQDKT